MGILSFVEKRVSTYLSSGLQVLEQKARRRRKSAPRQRIGEGAASGAIPAAPLETRPTVLRALASATTLFLGRLQLSRGPAKTGSAGRTHPSKQGLLGATLAGECLPYELEVLLGRC